jgi:tRNA threonylcarbamoyladenosine biosynthesis protein TsaB
MPSEHCASEAEGADRTRIHPALHNETVLAHRFEEMERGHAERLALMVRETMEDSGLGFGALDRLAVTIGPGTFTGQRVGYAFMRSLRLALARPLIGVTTLAAMAAAAMAETGAEAACVLHDAKRGEVYAYADCKGVVLLPVQLAKLEDATTAMLRATETLSGSVAFAGTAGAVAAQRWRERGRETLEAEPDSIPRPLYLRPPDARLPAG